MRTAAYARYSTELQSSASIDDQLRNVRGFCDRMGWAAPVVYQDAALSGSRNDRPGYLSLLRDAARFDVILVDDLSRLSRDSVEAQQQVRRLRFQGVRVVAVTDGIDTNDKGHKLGVGLRGLMGELYLDDLRDKTHRGLAGRALTGSSAGGLPYGYRVTSVGLREPDEAQAAVVRRIFDAYLAGFTAREIAAELNRELVLSPRGGTWAMSAIHGDTRRGIGILANPIYVGRQVWNRSRWVKHPDSGRRVRQERPASEWVTTEHPELAIVELAAWDAVQRRLRGQSRNTGTKGRPPKHLLSGLLRCGDCGGPMVAVDRYRYGCAAAKDRGICQNKVRVARTAAESALLAGVKAELLSDDAFRRFQKAAAAKIKAGAHNADAIKRKLADAQRVRDNVMQAIRVGIITPSTKAELERAELAISQAERELAEHRPPAQLLPHARQVWQRMIENLSGEVRSTPKARETLRAMLGTVTVKTENGAPFAEIAPCQITMVAGAGSVRYLTAPVRIPLTFEEAES